MTWQSAADILKNTIITADEFSHWDHHKIRLFDVEAQKLTRRTMKDGDQGSLWEYLDWMLSASSNAAAAMTMRDAMLLKQYGKDYPASGRRNPAVLQRNSEKGTDRTVPGDLLRPDHPQRPGYRTSCARAAFLPVPARKRCPAAATATGLPGNWCCSCLRMEQGRLVDEFSSREMKRLLYMTERRIRYASSPALRDSAVYFKSGSLYSCQEEEGFKCGKYMGNKKNYMNSVAIVENFNEGRPLHYIATLISNVLRKNSAVDHQTMGTRIHRIMEKANPVPPPALTEPEPLASEVQPGIKN